MILIILIAISPHLSHAQRGIKGSLIHLGPSSEGSGACMTAAQPKMFFLMAEKVLCNHGPSTLKTKADCSCIAANY
jgi:hypothetical protein